MEKMKVNIETYSYNGKFNEYVFCPSNAIECEFYRKHKDVVAHFLTSDGILVRPEFIATWNNKDNLFEDELDKECQNRYGMSFEEVKSLWYNRLRFVDDYWHLIKLIKL